MHNVDALLFITQIKNFSQADSEYGANIAKYIKEFKSK